MERNILKVEALSYVSGGQTILENVSFTVMRGQLSVIVGPNGAGKSTLLKIILGLLKPTGGCVVRGSPLGKMSYVPQRVVIDPRMPINVESFLECSKSPYLTVKESLDLVWGHHLRYRRFQDLSGGEVQRILVARALRSKPDLLLLDEALQGMDLESQHKFQDLLYSLLPQTTLLLVSHDLHWVMAQSHHVVCLNRHICCQGAPQHLEKVWITHPHLFAFYPHHHNHSHLSTRSSA